MEATIARQISEVTDTTNTEGQLRALEEMQEYAEQTQTDYLAERAVDSMSHFIEYMTPDEPPAPHMEYLCDLFQAMEAGDVPRAVISTPPGHAKTKTLSHMGVAWFLGKNPRNVWLHAGHSQKFAENKFGNPTRNIVKDVKYQMIFPDAAIHPKTDAAGEWMFSNGRGGYVVKGVGQKIAGYRGRGGGMDDLIGSVEDANNALVRDKVWRWIWSDYLNRMLPGFPVFMIATRWHPDDPIGRIEEKNRVEKELHSQGKLVAYEPWEVLNLDAWIEDEIAMARDPLGRDMGEALWSGLFDVQVLQKIKNDYMTVGLLKDWNALYKGKPREAEGNIVKGVWFKRYKALPVNIRNNLGQVTTKNIKRITMSVDCAQTKNERSSFTVATVWVQDVLGKHYLAYVERQKVEYNELCALLIKTAQDWKVDSMLVENKGHGTAFLQQYANIAPCPLIPINPDTEGNKEFRFDAITPEFQAGNIHLPDNAPWLGEYEEEVLAFPNSTYKDQVDSTSQYFNYMRKGLHNYGTKRISIR